MYRNINDRLKRDGYIHIKNCVPGWVVSEVRDSTDGMDVNYPRLLSTLSGIGDTLKYMLGWDPVFTKLRMSNTTNKDDANFRHTDLRIMSTTNEVPPIFTTLIYTNPAIMSIMPGTHTNPHPNLIDMTKERTIDLHIEPGDLLVFYSCIIHRGQFHNVTSDRKLLQLFQTYPTPELYKKYSKLVYTINSSHKYRSFINFNYKFGQNPIFNKILDVYSYFQYRLFDEPFLGRCDPPKEYPYASNEPHRRIETYDDKTINIYVPLNKV